MDQFNEEPDAFQILDKAEALVALLAVVAFAILVLHLERVA